ncbi:hypothetical protein lerEdw1_006541 [Lerista edwardsae]|nr:hypothetical protein lerEdw1_006541 [Lerista edwardsae]
MLDWGTNVVLLAISLFQTEHGGNSHGKPCVFPFIYQERKFYTCTDEDAKPRMFWCATTSNFDKDKKWSYCADTNPSCLIGSSLPEGADQKMLRNSLKNGHSSDKNHGRDQEMIFQTPAQF